MKRLLLALLPAAAFAAAPINDWSPNLTATAAWAGNLSDAQSRPDRIDAARLSADVVSSGELKAWRNDALHATVHLGGDWVPRFTALSRVAAGLRGDWRHMFGPGADAPVFSIEAGGDSVFASEAARRGVDATASLKLTKSFGEMWHTALTERFDDFHAKHAVFDNRSNETALEIARDINPETRLAVTGRWRDGDVVSYSTDPRPDLDAAARNREILNTFHHPMTAYAETARTAAGKIALIHVTSEDSVVVVSYEFARTRGTALRFENHTFAVSLVRQY